MLSDDIYCNPNIVGGINGGTIDTSIFYTPKSSTGYVAMLTFSTRQQDLESREIFSSD